MKRNIYLAIIALATIACIIFGVAVHTGGLFSRKLFGINDLTSETLYDGSASDSSASGGSASGGSASGTASGGSASGTAITDLLLNTEMIDVNLTAGDAFRVEYNGAERLKPVVTENDSTLEISQKNVKKGLFDARNINCRLNITVPSDLLLNSLTVNTNVGDLDLSGFQCANTEIVSDVDDLTVKNADLGTASIIIKTGDSDIINCRFDSLVISQDVGDIEVDTAGAFTDYTLDLKTKMGEVEVGDSDCGRSFVQQGNGPSLTAHAEVGDVEVK